MELLFEGMGLINAMIVMLVLEFNANATLCKGLNRGLELLMMEFIAIEYGRVVPDIVRVNSKNQQIMFKNSVEAKTQQRLSSADRKKLKRTIKERFPNASNADIDTLLPPKVEITVAKYPNRVLVYRLESGVPMFFDADGRGLEIFPSVYALWKVPELLPSFVLKGGEVSHFIIGGADLMVPGISIPAEGLPSFFVGEPWAVKVPGNPAPIAVGTTTMSSTEVIKAGLHEKALRICHCCRDLLWESTEGRYVPDAGFLEDVVLEDPSLSSTSCRGSDSYDGDASIDDENGMNNKEVAEAIGIKDANSILDHISDSPDVGKDIVDQVISDVRDLKTMENVDQSTDVDQTNAED